jgi:hypothetical protein
VHAAAVGDGGGRDTEEMTSASESSSRPMAELFWRQRAMRPSSTSNTSANGMSAQAAYTCQTSPVRRYDITENSAPTPQKALARVNQSARWNSRIIEKGLAFVLASSMPRMVAPAAVSASW